MADTVSATVNVSRMSEDEQDYVAITRTFRDLSDAEVADIEKASTLVKYGWGGGFGWDEVLRSQRVLLISEAGVGKTRECKAECYRLRAAGEAAFFSTSASSQAPRLGTRFGRKRIVGSRRGSPRNPRSRRSF